MGTIIHIHTSTILTDRGTRMMRMVIVVIMVVGIVVAGGDTTTATHPGRRKIAAKEVEGEMTVARIANIKNIKIS